MVLLILQKDSNLRAEINTSDKFFLGDTETIK